MDNIKGGLSYISWIKFLREPGCPLCTARQHLTRSYIETFLHEYINDLNVRAKIDQSRGFCNEHAWQIQKMEENVYHDGMKNGIIYEYLIAQLIRELETYRQRVEQPQPIKTSIFRRNTQTKIYVEMLRIFEKNGKCPVCEHVDLLEGIYADEFLRMIRILKENGFDKKHIFCLKHLLMLLRQSENPEDTKYLLDDQLSKLNNLHHQLKYYLKHHSYLHKHEPIGEEEATSWIRAVAIFAGHNDS
ncbi:MAG: hypothetical protein HPY81_02905 [Firmicutes bacterium]|nr:hypothetical protein [Bacillota bacterium]